MPEERKSPFDPIIASHGPEPKPQSLDVVRVLSYPSLSVVPLVPKEKATDAAVPPEEVEIVESGHVGAIVEKA
jgi:hypothetical protein